MHLLLDSLWKRFLAALFPNGKWESDASGMGLADFIIQGGEGSDDNLISLKTQKLGSMNRRVYKQSTV